MDALTHRTFNENPIPINAFLAVAGFVVGVVLVVFITVAGQRLHSQEGNDEEREPLLLEEEDDD